MLGVSKIAGNETTATLIGNGLRALMRHPENRWSCCAECPDARDAINRGSALRQPSAETDFRIAKSAAVVGGRTIRSGEGVILLTESANSDEAVFSEPDWLDITRKGPSTRRSGMEYSSASAPSWHDSRRVR